MKVVNQATLYETYIDNLLKRRWNKKTDFISPNDRLVLMQELAQDMYLSQNLTVHFSEFPERVAKYFNIGNSPDQIAFLERDLRTQSYLSRDSRGHYRFAHKSFIEYFFARKLAKVFDTFDSNLEQAIELWGSRLFLKEIYQFLSEMILDHEKLIAAIHLTRHKNFEKIGYFGTNALHVLKLKNYEFLQQDFHLCVLREADLSGLDLSGTSFQNADLSKAKLPRTVYDGKRLEGSSLKEYIEGSRLFRGANLTQVKYQLDTVSTRSRLDWRHNCFLQGTLISLPGSQFVAIEQVKLDTKILSYSVEKQQIVEGVVIEVLETEVAAYLVINHKLMMTASESVFTGVSWKSARDLKLGDVVFGLNTMIRINDIREVSERKRVFHLKVVPHHNFFAEGFLVHNQAKRAPM